MVGDKTVFQNIQQKKLQNEFIKGKPIDWDVC